jgi:hypothetical protein
LYGIDVRLKQTTVVWRFNCTEDHDVISKKRRYLEWLTALHKSLINILKSRGPKRVPCGTPNGITKDDESFRDTNLGFSVG